MATYPDPVDEGDDFGDLALRARARLEVHLAREPRRVLLDDDAGLDHGHETDRIARFELEALPHLRTRQLGGRAGRVDGRGMCGVDFHGRCVWNLVGREEAWVRCEC